LKNSNGKSGFIDSEKQSFLNDSDNKSILREFDFKTVLISSGLVDMKEIIRLEKLSEKLNKSLDRLIIDENILSSEEIEKIIISAINKRDLIDVFLSMKLINSENIEQLRVSNGGVLPCNPGRFFLKKGIINEEEYARALAIENNVEFIDISEYEFDDELIKKVDINLMKRYSFIPFYLDGNKLFIIVSDPGDIQMLDEIEYATGYDIKTKVSVPSEINRILNTIIETSLDQNIVFRDFSELMDTEKESSDPEESLKNAGPVVKMIDALLLKAILKKASDVHFEAYEDVMKIKYRIDGVLFEVLKINSEFSNMITSRIKIISNLDIAEKRKPQDGRFTLSFENREVDFRVSILPSIHGETVVLRILDKTAVGLDVRKLGFEDYDLKKFLKNIKKPYGMILVAGPTGSGKTTTLYSAINEINKPEDKLITIEDPVEFQFDDIVQVAVNEKQGLSFASGLRSVVRQDPDKIMIGEIRDIETAEIAVNAALTGHLVLSSIHANNVFDCISRLVNMGVDIYQVVSSFNLIVSQRLVRKICEKCKIEDIESKKKLKELVDDWQEHEDKVFYKGRGCRFCHKTGYRGRVAIYEVLPMSSRVKEMLLVNSNSVEVRRAAVEEGMHSLRGASWIKVCQGVTTIDEMNRVTFED
jgi:type IV pilus assembly protein PilB